MILLHTRTQLIEAAKNVCTSSHNSSTCAIQVTGDRFSCYDNSRLVYVARVIGTTSTTAKSFLEYLRMLGPVEVSLHNETFSVISSPSCPLSIPSAEESNCSQEAVSTTITAHTNTSTTITTTTTTATSTISVAPTTSAPNSDDDNSTIVVIVTMACLVGIVIMTLGIICAIVICHQCHRYRNRSNR